MTRIEKSLIMTKKYLNQGEPFNYIIEHNCSKNYWRIEILRAFSIISISIRNHLSTFLQRIWSRQRKVSKLMPYSDSVLSKITKKSFEKVFLRESIFWKISKTILAEPHPIPYLTYYDYANFWNVSRPKNELFKVINYYLKFKKKTLRIFESTFRGFPTKSIERSRKKALRFIPSAIKLAFLFFESWKFEILISA